MKIYGIDFTSAPSKTKAIVLAESWIEVDILHIEKFHRFIDFCSFMEFLRRSPIWIAGVDFPLGQPRKLIENLQWGKTWAEYVQIVGQMSKAEFVATLNQYRQDRAIGDREHLRRTDKLTGAISPMKVYGVPVGKMFFAGAPRMLAAGFSILPCHPTNDPRIILEVYPAIIARSLIGKHSYKSDEKRKQTTEMQLLRQEMINQVRSPSLREAYSFGVNINDVLASKCIQDASGDTIDALFAAIQTAWTFRQPNYGIPKTCDRLEGWICGKLI
ncbi:DUF429 domain-containing protein [Pseudanabaena sp. ABRG5-3]|uniref:DUF429 domain-containing protein n=1 Tax=Pseudanabaena sp. ABRG5-3 TaxID=685565 RepID=UPI000DC6E9B2|nr:DUF429 domain-containing protein [Pseudanabaena sp. ABRG5-3]BBC25158.1 hypothetical protein ABRG53_2901 [Pseudanabaena sp. ABRG5-3]